MTAKLLGLRRRSAAAGAITSCNAARVRPQILERLRAGAAVALVSDAGTPLVSDPGYKLVRDAIAAEVEVFALPGPSAALAGLLVSGLPTTASSADPADAAFAAAARHRRDRGRTGDAHRVRGGAPPAERLVDLAAELGPRPPRSRAS